MRIQDFIQDLKRFAVESFKFIVTGANGTAGPHIVTGTGAPEGVVGAPIGSLYLRQDGSTATTLYVKTAAGTAAVAATGTLTATTVAAGNTVTIAGVVYTFRAALTSPAVPREVLIGANIGESRTNLRAAINGSAGAGTTYGAGTEAHALVTAAGTTTVDVTAKQAGYYANAITTTAVLSSGSWGAGTLTGGKDAAADGWTAK